MDLIRVKPVAPPPEGRPVVAEGSARSLHPEIFPMAILPRTAFDGVASHGAPPADIWCSDLTLSIGQENGPPWPMRAIVDFYEAVHHLGGPRGALRQFECAIGRPEERSAIEAILKYEYSFPEVVAWLPVPEHAFRQAARLGLREAAFPAPASDFVSRAGWPSDPKGRLSHLVDLVREAFDEKVVPKVHLEDVTRADWAGWVLPAAHELKKVAERVDMPVKLRLVDTTGVGLPHGEAGTPRGTARLVELVRARTGYPPEWLEWLGANDLGMACANGLAAWLAGCSSCAGTVAGVGERAGWAPTELLLAHYVGLRGEANGVGFKALPGVVKPLREAGREVPPRAPLCGDAVLQTSHPESALRPETAFAFDPERVLGRPVQEGFRPGCGLDELARCVARLRGWSVADPSNPEVVRLKEWLDASFAGGRSSAVGFDEIRARLQTFARDVPGGGEAPPPI